MKRLFNEYGLAVRELDRARKLVRQRANDRDNAQQALQAAHCQHDVAQQALDEAARRLNAALLKVSS